MSKFMRLPSSIATSVIMQRSQSLTGMEVERGRHDSAISDDNFSPMAGGSWAITGGIRRDLLYHRTNRSNLGRQPRETDPGPSGMGAGSIKGITSHHDIC